MSKKGPKIDIDRNYVDGINIVWSAFRRGSRDACPGRSEGSRPGCLSESDPSGTILPSTTCRGQAAGACDSPRIAPASLRAAVFPAPSLPPQSAMVPRPFRLPEVRAVRDSNDLFGDLFGTGFRSRASPRIAPASLRTTVFFRTLPAVTIRYGSTPLPLARRGLSAR